MPEEPDIEKLRRVRNILADVFSNQVKDEVYDNGFLNVCGSAIRAAEDLIEILKKRSG